MCFLEPPVFTNKPPSHVAVVRGYTLSLCCEATGSPRPRIEWLRAQQSSDSPLAFQENGCLEVNTASNENYICRATNQFGRAETATETTIVNLIGWIFHISYLLQIVFFSWSNDSANNYYVTGKFLISKITNPRQNCNK